MIKISSDNFFKQSHPPVLSHFEKEDMDNDYGDYAYYDMHHVVASALAAIKEEVAK